MNAPPPVPPQRVGYVVKRYPRYSETFIVNELLAHEAAGLPVDIFSLNPTLDTHFQDAIARVRAPVHYLPGEGSKVAGFWTALGRAAAEWPGFNEALPEAWREEARDVFQAVALARAARQLGIAHLHAHFATSATTVARLAASFGQLTYSFTAHAKDIFHDSVEPEDLRRKIRDAAAVVTVSDFNVQHLRRAFGAVAGRVRRIYNGLDLARFPYDAPARRPPCVLAVGRLVEKKGFAVLVEACALLAKQGRPFRCQIIGTGDQEAALRTQIERMQLQGRVELPGPRPQADIIKLLQSAAVLAAPCVVGEDGNRDGLPTVLLEAMALGTPCVSTDVTGIPEVVRHEMTGLMVPQRDAAALAAAIERLFEDGALRVRLAAEARKLVETEFDVQVNAARLREVFATARLAACPAPAIPNR